MTALPAGWKEAPLGDVCQVVSGATPKTDVAGYWGGDIRWLTPNDLSKDRSQTLYGGERTLTQAGYDSCSARRFPAGSVIVSSRAPVGYVAISGEEMCTNQGCKTAVPPDYLDSKYLYWYLLAAKPDLEARASGTTFKEISGRRFAETLLRFPDLEEQHLIVQLLEDHLSRLEAAEQGLARSSRGTDAVVRSALSQGLRGHLVKNDFSEGTAEAALGFRPQFEPRDHDRVWEVPDGWLWARVGDVFEVNVGATPSRGDATLWAGDLPWVSSGEVSFSRISQTRERITREAAGNPAKRIHPPGTVMLAMIGEGRTRGQAGILDIEAAHNQNCASIRVSATQVRPEYVYGYLEERYLETRRAGSGGQQQALNKAAIQRFPIPLPPLATQRALVATWDDIRSSASRLDGEIARASQRSASLRRSLLAAAFSGELSRRWRSVA